MGIEYRQATAVSIGDTPTSTQWNELAEAFNDRLDWGIGNPSYRAWWWAYTAVRKIINNDGAVVSANDEWFKNRGLVDPLTNPDAGWGDPVAGDGGANVANPLMAFIFGLDPTVDQEDVRLSPVAVSAFSTLANAWDSGVNQRGAYDPDTLKQGAPAVEAAVSHRTILNGYDPAVYLQKYGSWIGVPVVTMDCPAESIPNVHYKFKALKASLSDLTFDTCPLSGTGVENVEYQHDHYRIVFFGGATQDLLYSDYMEGPYHESNALLKTFGDQVDVNLFVLRFQ